MNNENKRKETGYLDTFHQIQAEWEKIKPILGHDLIFTKEEVYKNENKN